MTDVEALEEAGILEEIQQPVDRFDAIIEEMNDGKKRKEKQGIKDTIRKWWKQTSSPGKTSTVSSTNEDQEVGEIQNGRKGGRPRPAPWWDSPGLQRCR